MLKPDFGPVERRIVWNEARIAYVRHLAEERQMPAREIALDIGLAANQAPRIFELCKRCDIQLSGQAGRPRQASEAQVFSVGVKEASVVLLKRLAKRHSMTAGQVAELILNAAVETGEPFCDNLLDLDAGQ